MKKTIVTALAILFLASLLTTPSLAIGETLHAGSGTPVIDGAIDDVWLNTERQRFKYTVAGDLNDGELPGSCSAYVSSLVDEEALYFLIDLSDNDFIFEGNGEFDSDYVQVYIDEADLFDKTWQDGQVSFRIYPHENGKVEVIHGALGEGSCVALGVRSTSKRIIEIKYVPTLLTTDENLNVLVDFRFYDVYKNADGENALAYSLTWSDELNEGDLDSANWSYLKPGVASSTGFTRAEDAAASIGGNLLHTYHFEEGSEGNGGEGPKNLWDGDVGTKFCTTQFTAKSVARLDGQYHITGVIMATANDNEAYPGRAPNDWELQGSTNGKNWETIVSGDESFFKDVNFTYFAQKVEKTENAYRYIRFYNRSTKSGTMQVSELLVCGIKIGAAEESEAPAQIEIPVNDANLLPITGAHAIEAIAAPTVPQENPTGLSSDAIATLIVAAFTVALIALCGVIVTLQTKKPGTKARK